MRSLRQTKPTDTNEAMTRNLVFPSRRLPSQWMSWDRDVFWRLTKMAYSSYVINSMRRNSFHVRLTRSSGGDFPHIAGCSERATVELAQSVLAVRCKSAVSFAHTHSYIHIHIYTYTHIYIYTDATKRITLPRLRAQGNNYIHKAVAEPDTHNCSLTTIHMQYTSCVAM